MTDREKLIEILKYGMDKYFLLNFEAEIFADLLIANGVVVREKGEWLPCGFGKEIMCSVCRCELDDVWEYRHCPNCGADMRKGENDG